MARPAAPYSLVESLIIDSETAVSGAIYANEDTTIRSKARPKTCNAAICIIPRSNTEHISSGSSAPADATSAPADASSALVDGSSAPADGSSALVDGSSALVDGSSAPADASSAPADASSGDGWGHAFTDEASNNVNEAWDGPDTGTVNEAWDGPDTGTVNEAWDGPDMGTVSEPTQDNASIAHHVRIYQEFKKDKKWEEFTFDACQDHTNIEMSDRTHLGRLFRPRSDPENTEQVDSSDETVRVKLKVYSHDADFIAHIDVVFIFNWMEDGFKKTSAATLSLIATNSKINEYCFLGDLPAEFNDHPECNVFTSDSNVLLKIDYNAVKIWSVNILASGDFGPHQAVVERLRSFTVHGGQLVIAASDAEGLPNHIDDYVTHAAKDYVRDPLKDFWTDDAFGDYFRPYHIDKLDETTGFTGRIRTAFRDFYEYSTLEAVGAHFEQAFMEKCLEDIVVNLSGRFLTIPANPNALLMLLEEDPENKLLALGEGDVVSARIHALNAGNEKDDNWTGKVIGALPMFPSDRIIVLRRRYNSENQEWRGLDPSELGTLPSMSQVTDSGGTLQIIDAQQPRAVDIKVQCDKKSYKRRSESLSKAYDTVRHELNLHQSSPTAEFLTAARFDRLAPRDLFGEFGITDEEIDALANVLSPIQQEVLEYVKALPGGFGFISGCAGAGKSRTLVVILAHLLRHLIAVHSNKDAVESNRDALGALVTTAMNENADDMVRKFVDAFAALDINDAIVIRKYSPDTDRSIFTKDIDARDAHEPALNLDAAHEAMAEAESIARIVFQEFDRGQSRFYGKDARVTKQGMAYSLPSLVINILGDNNSESTRRARAAVDTKLLSDLGDALSTYDQPEQASPETRKELTEKFNEVLMAVFKVVDVVVTTPQMAADASLYARFSPRVFALDEAAKVTSVDSLCWAFYPGCKLRLFLGDAMQSRPRMDSMKSNPCAMQVAIPLFSRMIMAGFPHISQTEQHRFNEGLAKLLGDVFYHRPILCAESTSALREAGTSKFLNVYPSSSVLVDIGTDNQEMKSPYGSRYNPSATAGVINIISMLVNQYEYLPEEIGVLTFYTAQRTIHENIANSFAAHEAEAFQAVHKRNGGLMIETVERAQGQSRPVIILEIPNTTSIGFIDAARLLTGLSRAECGLIIVANLQALGETKGFSSKCMGRVFSHIRRHGHVRRNDTSKTVATLQRHMPSLGHRHTYTAPVDTLASPDHTG